MGKRSLDDARTFGRSIQPTHDLQPEAGSADGSSLFAILDANEIEADAQPKKITLSGVANVVGPLLTPTAIPAAGANTQVQFNDGGFFGADSGLTYNKTTDALSAGAFIPTGDTVPTNGVYLPSANSVALATNGNGRLFINSTGLVGLGTSSPRQLLDVQGSLTFTGSQAGPAVIHANSGVDNAALALRAGTTASVLTQIDVNSGWDGSPIGGWIAFKTANTERARFTSTGLGIGTTSPGTTIHVGDGSVFAVPRGGGSSFTPQAAITAATGVAGISVGVNGSSQNGRSALFLDDTNGVWGLSHTWGTTARPFVLMHDTNERLRVDTSGRLLVGTSSSSGAPSAGAVIQLADQFSVRAVNGGGITNRAATTASATTLNCVIDVPISGNIYASFIGTLYVCQQLTDSSKSFLAEYRVKVYNSGGTAVFTLVDSADDSSPNNAALSFAYSNTNRQITVTSTWTTATSSTITCTLVGAGCNA